MIAFFAFAACSIMVSVNAEGETQEKSLGDERFDFFNARKSLGREPIPAALRLRQKHVNEQVTKDHLKLLIEDVYDSFAVMRVNGEVMGIGAEGILTMYTAPAKREIIEGPGFGSKNCWSFPLGLCETWWHDKRGSVQIAQRDFRHPRILTMFTAPAKREIIEEATQKIDHHYVQTVRYYKIKENGSTEYIVKRRYWILDNNVFKVVLEDADIVPALYRT